MGFYMSMPLPLFLFIVQVCNYNMHKARLAAMFWFHSQKPFSLCYRELSIDVIVSFTELKTARNTVVIGFEIIVFRLGLHYRMWP